MNIGKQISCIRKDQGLTQEKFGEMFHVTRQTVSNWENEKSYPDLQILVAISDQFQISLDALIKDSPGMIEAIDRERMLGSMRSQKIIIDFLTGAGTGIMASCLFAPDTVRRTVSIVIGLAMLGIGWYKKAVYDKKVLHYIENKKDI